MEEDSLSQILEEHKKVRAQIGSLDLVSDELAQIDLLESAEDWVGDKMGGGRAALVRLGTLLTEMDEGLKLHWHREDNDLIPFLKDNGQTEFANKLLSQHKQTALRLKQYRSTAERLVRGGMSARGLRREVRTLRYSVIDLLEHIQKHAISEEEMLFRLGHGV